MGQQCSCYKVVWSCHQDFGDHLIRPFYLREISQPTGHSGQGVVSWQRLSAMGDFLEISSKSCGLWGESERQEWGTDVHLERSGDKRAGGNPTDYTVVVGFISLSFYLRVLTCGRKLLGLWPATQENSSARWSAPNFHQPDSVILQVRPSLSLPSAYHRAPESAPRPPVNSGWELRAWDEM